LRIEYSRTKAEASSRGMDRRKNMVRMKKETIEDLLNVSVCK
jgi:hypothetical protein